MNTEIALMAGDFTLTHKLAFADAGIYVGARKHQAELITADDHFEDLPGVNYFPKQEA